MAATSWGISLIVKILSMQGGGCLGYVQALILAELEKRAGRPCNELFELVAGTSVGSINDACVASGVPATGIVEFFTQFAPRIFDSTLLTDIEALNGPKYDAETLEAALQATLKEKTMADCSCRFIATAYDYATDRIVRFDSGVVSSQDKNEIVIGKDSPIQLWQICRASSAAQTYFPAYQIEDMVLLDGGNTSDNAPDMLALTEAIAGGTNPSDIRMLSLGSGDTVWKVDARKMIAPSPIRAGLETIKIVFSAGEDAQVAKAKKILGNGHYRLSPDLGDGIAIDDWPACCSKIPQAVTALLITSSAVLEEFC